MWWSASIGGEALRDAGRLTHLWQLVCLGDVLCDGIGIGRMMEEKRRERRVSSGLKKRAAVGRATFLIQV